MKTAIKAARRDPAVIAPKSPADSTSTLENGPRSTLDVKCKKAVRTAEGRSGLITIRIGCKTWPGDRCWIWDLSGREVVVTKDDLENEHLNGDEWIEAFEKPIFESGDWKADDRSMMVNYWWNKIKRCDEDWDVMNVEVGDW